MSETSHRCEVKECGTARSQYAVSKDFRILNVCRSCMTEMTALYGWHLITSTTELAQAKKSAGASLAR